MSAGDRVQVRSAWNAWYSTDVHVRNLIGVHWLQPAGAPRPILHAHIECTGGTAAVLPHHCEGDEAPHMLRVCILKHDCIPTTYQTLARLADTGAPLSCAALREAVSAAALVTAGDPPPG